MADVTAPATPEGVRVYLGLSEADTDTEALNLSCAAANAFLRRYKGDEPPGDGWPSDWVLGTVMQAAGLYRRRNTPGGVDTFGDTGMYVRATDTEVERMLRIGRYAPPGVG